jgi:hypothetical protein
LINVEKLHEVKLFLPENLIFYKNNLEKISVMLSESVILLISTIKHMRKGNQLLLIPLTIWSGLEQSFLGAQFTKVEKFNQLFPLLFLFIK